MCSSAQPHSECVDISDGITTEIDCLPTRMKRHTKHKYRHTRTSPPLTYSITKHRRSFVWNEYFKDWNSRWIHPLEEKQKQKITKTIATWETLIKMYVVREAFVSRGNERSVCSFSQAFMLTLREGEVYEGTPAWLTVVNCFAKPAVYVAWHTTASGVSENYLSLATSQQMHSYI